MKSFPFYRRYLGMIALAVMLVLVPMYRAHALTLSPARVELSADAGQTLTGDIVVTNEQSDTRTFYVSQENFTANGDTGAPSFSSDMTGLASWISVESDSLTLKAGESRTISYVVRIPDTAEPGGYFSAIFWSTTPPGAGSGEVSIGAKVGMLLLLRVNGDVRESAGIASFTRGGHGLFYTTLPVSFVHTFHNSGADRVKPTGWIKIRNLGFVPAAKLDANKVDGNVLPGSTRKFETQWLKQAATEELNPDGGFFDAVQYQWKNFAVGIYRATLDLTYGVQTEVRDTQNLWFIVFPWQLLICILVALFIVFGIGRRIIKQYNRYIISQARGYDRKR